MLKVFLAEDEFIIREGIKNNIDWQSHGYEFCGEASDGELAFPLIQRLKPDIVITDIKMPFMDGLTLSGLIKKELPDTEIIILSGYEEFEYAKQGIQIGVARYLLKPIGGDTLLSEIDAVAEKIKEKQQENAVREQYRKEMEESAVKEKRELFSHLVLGDRSVTELIAMAEKLEISVVASFYNIILFKAQSTAHAYEEYSDSMVLLENAMLTIANDDELLLFDRGLEGKAFLLKGASEEELVKRQADYLQRLQKILETYPQIRYFGGIGTAVNRLTELPISFEAASHAFAHQYLVKESRFLTSGDASFTEGQEDLRLSEVNPGQLDRSKLHEFLKLGDKDEIVYFVDEFFGELSHGAMKSKIFRQYITMDVYFSVVEFLNNLQLPKEEVETPDSAPEILQSEESAIAYIQRVLGRALELREKKASSRYEDVVDEVIRYIEQNYAEEELSLNLLASHVNFSPNHLSMIFSQQTGQPFIKYLTDYRMNKAKELLRCTGKKSSAISMEVGYRDPHYFSYLFKKTQGMTPTQYRGGKAADGENT